MSEYRVYAFLLQIVPGHGDAHGLRWCVNEMERRYRLMRALSVRNLNGFNTKVSHAIKSENPLKDP